MSLFVRERPAATRRDFSGSGWGIPAPTSVPTPAQDYAYYGTVQGLQIAAVVACVGLRAGAMAQIPIKGYTTVDGRSKLMDVQPELYSDPSLHLGPSAWRIQMSISRDLWGWAFGRMVAYDGAGYPTKVEWLDPSICHPTPVAGGGLEWRVGTDRVDPTEYLHVPSRWVLPGNTAGISPLEYSGLVELAQLARNFGRDWFRQGRIPSAIIYSEQDLTKDEAEGLLARIMERWRNRQPAILGAGLKYEKVSISPDESQFLQTCTRVAADIAVSFNLPPARIGAAISGSDVSYQNLDQSQQQIYVDSVNPDLVVISETFDRHTRPGIFSRWQTGAFLRSDLLTRFKAYEIGLRSGFLVENEPRDWEDIAPLPGGDVPKWLRPAAPAAAPGPNDVNANPDGMSGGTA